MRKLYLTLVVLIVARIATAQSTSFTLEQCIDYALKNAISVQNAQLDEKSSVSRVHEITGQGLPQVSGSFNITQNQKLPRLFGQNIVSADHPGAFGFFMDVPGAADGDILARQNLFQLKGSANASIAINQLIFNGSYFVGLQAAQNYRELASKKTNQTRVETVDAVSKAFYLALINRERITLFNSNIARLDTLLRNTKALNQNGFAESIDVDRVQVTLNNLITEREKFMSLQVLSLELLKFQMNYPMESPIEISGDITTINPGVVISDYGANWDYSARPDFQVLEMNRKLQGLNVKNYYSQSLPTIGAFANLGYSTQSPTIGGLFSTNTPIKDDGEIGPDKWYNFSSFGVQVNVPIFGGLQLRHKIQQEKITLLKLENSIKQAKSGIDVEIKNAMTMYRNAIKTMESQKQNMELSAKIARVTKIKYEQGVGSNVEVLDAESSLKESQINYYNALYDALIAKVNLDKAYGKLLPETQN
jgi:outer membrane protein